MTKKGTKPPLVLTITLPSIDDDELSGTLLIQRGELGHICQFTYSHLDDLAGIIKDGVMALAAVEAEPPIIAEPAPPPVDSTSTKSPPPSPSEPTVDIPLKKGKKTVKISHLKLVGGETDAAAYREAVLIAAKFIDGRLWDGETPIHIHDVYVLAKKTKHLTAQDMALFRLDEFVDVGTPEAAKFDEVTPESSSLLDADDRDPLDE
jgi:hypothetical protein